MDTGNKTFVQLMTGSNVDAGANAIRHRIQNVSFNNTTELNYDYFCRINHNEYNYSSNPTYVSGSEIRVKGGSIQQPYCIHLNCWALSADNQLLAVGKLSEPLRKDPTIE